MFSVCLVLVGRLPDLYFGFSVHAPIARFIGYAFDLGLVVRLMEKRCDMPF